MSVALSIFETRVQKWLEDKPSTFERYFSAARVIWYHKVPNWVKPLSIIRFLLKVIIASAAPAIAHFIYASITLQQASLATFMLIALHTISNFLDRRLKKKNGISDQAESEIWVRIGDLVQTVRSGATLQKDRDASIVSILGIVENYARLLTNSPKDEICVSVALYVGSGHSKMRIQHRNPGSKRPINRTFKQLESVLGHRACMSGIKPRIVGDLRKFGKEGRSSPTQSTCNYLSIWFVPLVERETQRVRGFLSIDCIAAYAFNGGRDEKLVVTCEPLIDHLQDLVRGS